MNNEFITSIKKLKTLSPSWEERPHILGSGSILLTGGSGFLGIHLLRCLVCSGRFKNIYTIARTPEKLKAQALYFGIDGPWIKQVKIIQGDLLTMDLGQLPSVETVIHGAAQIHALKSRSQLWADNVEVTRRLLSFFSSAHFVFISTLSVFVSSNMNGFHKQKPLDITDEHEIYGGYAQTKAIGELMCMEHRSCTIFRLGLLTGSKENGVFVEDFFIKTITALKRIGGLPKRLKEAFVDMTPVDVCAEKILLNIDSHGVHHIANCDSISLSEIARLLNLKELSDSEWGRYLKKEPALISWLLKFAVEKETCLREKFEFFNVDLFQSTGHRYEGSSNFGSNEDLFLKYVKILEKEKT